ncbi:MAG: dienelactone hydrolase family protein [Kiloniellales bacterium]|nr:dienelactone hydrolase family protein [Kiloniellales bacterium]
MQTGSEIKHHEGAAFEVRDVAIPPYDLKGILTVPPTAKAIVLFAHGSGSSRLSPRNTFVASALQKEGLGTLLFDLLRPEEELDRANVFDIELLAERLLAATRWVRKETKLEGFQIGYFGASTGAAAALRAAATEGNDIAAIVSRGGRPDLTGPGLPKVRAPSLFIVGGDDQEVLALNRAAMAEMTCEKDLFVVPEASHLFEEPGALDVVVGVAGQWFTKHLSPRQAA